MTAEQFRWLSYGSRPGAWIAEGSLFVFVRGASASTLMNRASLPGVEDVDWSSNPEWDHPFAVFGVAAYDDPSGWAVLYCRNSYPDAFLNQLLAEPFVAEAVVVFWDVNGASEFSYWKARQRI